MIEKKPTDILVEIAENEQRVYDKGYADGKRDAMDSLVHCKDCKHWLHDFPGCTDAIGRCEWANYMVGCNGYCVYGERRTDDRETG
jgi:hypothetical protein